MTSTYSPHCHGIDPHSEIKDVFGLVTKNMVLQFLCKAAKKVGKQKEWKYGDVIKALMDLI